MFPSATNIRGAYYLPDANILFSNNNECWGSFAANQIAMTDSDRVVLDLGSDGRLDGLAQQQSSPGGAEPGQEFSPVRIHRKVPHAPRNIALVDVRRWAP